jgi:hypothetical protein
MNPELIGLLPIPFYFNLVVDLFLSVDKFEASSEYSLFSLGLAPRALFTESAFNLKSLPS